MKSKPQFNFTKEQHEEIKELLQRYFSDELEVELGSLQTDLFLEFLNEQVGRYYYNLGVLDAMAAIKEKTGDLVLLIKE